MNINTLIDFLTALLKLLIVNFSPACPYKCLVGTPAADVQFRDRTFGLSNLPNGNIWLWQIIPNTANVNTLVYLDGTSAASKSPKIRFTVADNYSVSLTVTNTEKNKTRTCFKENLIQVKSIPYEGTFVLPGFVESGFVD